SFVITGSLSKPRKEIAQMIEEGGGRVLSAISRKTDYLVCGENPGSKLQKAKESGVKIISESDLYGMIGNPK
ncbi:MAG: NAD-dependent DNA ligase LigA, partial [Candidatus Dadabacteria bacterium]